MNKYLNQVRIKTKKLKPVTPGMRHQICLEKGLLSRSNRLVKNLCYNVHRAVGRSSMFGRITVWGKGSGCKKLYRNVNLSNESRLGVLLFTTYDPNRTAFISLNFDLLTFSFYYSLAVNNMFSGAIQVCNKNVKDLFKGFRSPLNRLTPGSLINCLKVSGKNATLIRSAGVFGQLIQKGDSFCRVRLPSSQIIIVSSLSYATLGCLDNIENRFIVLGKAGKSRQRGVRPSVRGIAMNPVDHPHGGRTNGGRPSVTPWGIPTKGPKTSSSKAKKLYKIQ